MGSSSFVTIQYQPWQSFRLGLFGSYAWGQTEVTIQYQPWQSFRLRIDHLVADLAKDVTIQYQPWQSFRQLLKFDINKQ